MAAAVCGEGFEADHFIFAIGHSSRKKPTTRGLPEGAALATITIDNTQTNGDVHVKLYRKDKWQDRECFIPAGESFTMKRINPDVYDIRYRDLDTGSMAKSDPFEMDETETADGVNYVNMSLTLYQVRGGNASLDPIDEDEFNGQ